MKVDAPVTLKDKQQKEDIFVQVIYCEKQLLASIYSRGILHKDVQELYRKVRAGYESILLNDYDIVELQEIEYLLWKLHYKHIDEFRKRISQRSTNSENIRAEDQKDEADVESNINRHMEGFKSFLSEATDFYVNLIGKFRRSCGLPEELKPYKDSGSLKCVEATETTKLSKCEYACHRFLICLGDLARYSELCKKQGAPKWSVAFTYYLQATRICPESGNPQNQLALLATYVGDSFVALYHCIRSLAVKEPFPDAWNNLLLLFEENRSSCLSSISSESQLDFLKPSESISLPSHSGCVSSNNNHLKSTNAISEEKTELWLLLVRLTSFFLVKSSLEDFPGTLSSTVEHLEAMVTLDDEQLKATLESYGLMDSSRRGPYRALQLVTVFIFILDNQIINPQKEKLNGKDNEQQSQLTELALVAAFICITRLLERCLKGNRGENCHLLPAMLVYVEWLVGAFGRAEAYADDEKVGSAMSYFFDALADLLNRLDLNEGGTSLDNTALWEDHELRGFEPIAYAQTSLDFTSHQEWVEDSDCRNLRHRRIFRAGMKLMDKSNGKNPFIFYDKTEKIFYSARSMESLAGASNSSLQVTEPLEQKCRPLKSHEKDSPGDSQFLISESCQSLSTEDEEVILFKPIMRHNSAPLYKYVNKTDQISAEGTKEQIIPADECLRRATSMIAGKNQIQVDGSSFRTDATNSRYTKPNKQQEPLLKDSVTCPAGPPSLSAWVFDRESVNFERDKAVRDFNKHELSPIDELASESFSGLSINEAKNSVVDSGHAFAAHNNFPPTYVTPVPSAPLLPEDAIWFRGNSSSFQGFKSPVVTREADGILGAPPVSGYSNVAATHGSLDFAPVLPGLGHVYPPFLGMSSSEWLYHYRNSQKLEQTSSPIWPVPLNGPRPLSSFHANDVTRFDLRNPWESHLVSTPALYMHENPLLHPGSSLVYSAEEPRRDGLLGYQRTSPYICGAGTDTRPDQQPLLQYLKEEYWQLQREPQLRGSAFMGN